MSGNFNQGKCDHSRRRPPPSMGRTETSGRPLRQLQCSEARDLPPHRDDARFAFGMSWRAM